MYPRLSTNNSIMVRNAIHSALETRVDMTELLKSDFGDLLIYKEEGDSSVETTVDELYAQSDEIRQHFESEDLVKKRKVGAVDVSKVVKGDYLEELMTEYLHKYLDQVDSRALHDPGFWRFLALFPYRWYLLEREHEMKPHDYGGMETEKQKWLLIRTFISGRKAKSSGKRDEYLNTRAYRDARRRRKLSDGRTIDFYHSHIVRKRWHDCVAVSNAFIETCVAVPEALDEDDEGKRFANDLAKRLRRVTPNILLAALSSADLKNLFDEEKKKTLGL